MLYFQNNILYFSTIKNRYKQPRKLYIAVFDLARIERFELSREVDYTAIYRDYFLSVSCFVSYISEKASEIVFDTSRSLSS